MQPSYEKPIEVSRRPRQRRIEVYSPKPGQPVAEGPFESVEKPHRLERLEAAFHPVDVARVRAALFELLATGKIIAPDLDSKPLGLMTMFRRRTK